MHAQPAAALSFGAPIAWSPKWTPLFWTPNAWALIEPRKVSGKCQHQTKCLKRTHFVPFPGLNRGSTGGGLSNWGSNGQGLEAGLPNQPLGIEAFSFQIQPCYFHFKKSLLRLFLAYSEAETAIIYNSLWAPSNLTTFFLLLPGRNAANVLFTQCFSSNSPSPFNRTSFKPESFGNKCKLSLWSSQFALLDVSKQWKWEVFGHMRKQTSQGDFVILSVRCSPSAMSYFGLDAFSGLQPWNNDSCWNWPNHCSRRAFRCMWIHPSGLLQAGRAKRFLLGLETPHQDRDQLLSGRDHRMKPCGKSTLLISSHSHLKVS